MAVSFRKNIAQKVSSVDAPEIFNWSKWIRTPVVKQHTVEAFKKTKLIDVAHLNVWIDFPLFSQLEFQFEKQKLAKKLKKLQIAEPKTSFLFFNIVSPRVKKIDTGYSARIDIIKPYFGLRKPEMGFKHSETAWIKNLIINQVDFFTPSAEIFFSHSETEWIKNLIINSIDVTVPVAEIKFSHSETEWIKNLEINTHDFSISAPETKDALGYLVENFAELLPEEQNKFVPDIKKIELSQSEITTESYIEKEEVPEGMEVEFKLTGIPTGTIQIQDKDTNDEAVIEDVVFNFKPTELLPVDVGVTSNIEEITDYYFTPTEIKDCISELVPQIFDIDILSAAKFAGPESVNENIIQYSDFLNISSDIISYVLNPPVSINIVGGFTLQDTLIVSRIAEVFDQTVTKPYFTQPEIPEINFEDISGIFEEPATSTVKLPVFKNTVLTDKKFLLKTPQVKTGSIKLVKLDEPVQPEKLTTKEKPAKAEVVIPKEKQVKPEVIIAKEKTVKPEVIIPVAKKAEPENIQPVKQAATAKTAPPEKQVPVEKTVKKEPVILTYKPNIETRRDFWVGLDDEQKQEYETALSKELHQIEELVQSGNIFRFQSKVFILLHSLKQICNFAPTKAESPKSEFLLSQIDKIAKENKKAVVFSQYDKHGTQKLEQIFKKNKIKYYTFLSTSTTSEIERNLSGFRAEKNFSVLLASSKAATHRKYFGDLNYIIHFDQWWLPTTQWVIEDRAYNLDDKNFRPNQRINILSYYSKVLIEKRIFDKMKSDYLNMKPVFETVSSEIINRMITDEDWMNILGIEKKERQVLRVDSEEEKDDKDNKKEVKTEVLPKEDPILAIMKRLKTMNSNEIGGKISELFARLNFKDVKYENHSTDSATVKASAQIKEKKIIIAGKCFLNENIDGKDLQAFIDLAGKENVTKVFLLVLGKLTTPIDTEASGDSVILLTLEKIALLLHRMDLM